MPWKQDMPARDLLTYTIGVLKVGFVREENNWPERAKFINGVAQLNARTPTMRFHRDAARALVAYEIGGKRIEESLTVDEQCFSKTSVALSVRTCNAWVTRRWAPAGQLETMAGTFREIASSQQFNPAWNQRYNDLMAHRIRDQYAGQTAAMLASGERAQAQRTQAHRDYMAVQQRGADMRNYRFVEGQFLKQRASDDRVDYLLDCQRFRDGTSVGNCQNRQTAPRY
jgi:hypothetical protein